jgi:aminoglycoside phosphotransferase (APT) family kinase protein
MTGAADDPAGAVPGVDLGRLAAWMDDQGLPAGPITAVERLAGGTQNVLVRFDRGGLRFVLRRPPVHKRPDSDRTMRREARVLAALASTAVAHPRLIAACSDETVLGAAFYLMEPVDGANPTVELPAGYRTSAGWRHRLGLAMAEGAAAIAAVDHAGAGLADLGRPAGYLERQVGRWRSQLEGYHALAGYPGPEAPELDAIGAWLDAHRPDDFRPGLVHGDYHFANVLVTADRPALAAIIDWELATIGDPLLDLGGLLSTWPGPEGPPPGAPGVRPWDGFPTAAELVAHYGEISGRDLRSLPWYEVLAGYKIGIILEGTYARACAGQADPAVGRQLRATARRLFARASARIATA